MTTPTTNPLVVIPTYNEADNIKRMVETLIPMGVHVLVVDDDSPDGTSSIVENLMGSYQGKLNLLTRKGGKGGRGSATLDGFSWALQRDFDPILEMDADFSHDPKELPELLKASEKADVVVGSRYLAQSRIINWPLRRRVFSRLANGLAHFILRLPLSDYTNGYRCYRRAALQQVDPQRIPEKGYIVLSYIASQLASKGCKFSEIPTKFVNRQRGTSQLSGWEVFQAFRGILRVRSHTKS